MAFVLEDRPVRPLTADEVMQMVEAGILSEDERVELLLGVLTEKAVKSPEHEGTKHRLLRWLLSGGPLGGCEVRVEAALVVPDRTSLPEPDLSVVAGPADLHRHPDAALLAIEVSMASLRVDLGVKPPLYAAAAVREYWVVDVCARNVRVFTDPTPRGYETEEVREAGAVLEPRAVDVAPLDITELFAGL